MPGGLHGDDFAVAVEHAECDQHRNEHRKRRDAVEHAGREVHQVGADCGQRDVVAEDVADEFEKCEDQHEQHEPGQHQDEHRKNSRMTYSSRMRGNAPRSGPDRTCLKAIEQFAEVHSIVGEGGGEFHRSGAGGEADDGGQDSSAACHLPEKENVPRRRRECWPATPRQTRAFSLARQRTARLGQDVIENHQEECVDEPRTLAAPPRHDPEGHANQHQHQARGGIEKRLFSSMRNRLPSGPGYVPQQLGSGRHIRPYPCGPGAHHSGDSTAAAGRCW